MKDENGFSLIETIISIALMGIVAIAFLTGLSTSIKAVTVTKDHAVAESLARNELEYIKDCAYQYDASEYLINPLLDIPDGWNISTPVVEPVHGSDDGIQKVTVSVERGGETVLSLFTYKVDR